MVEKNRSTVLRSPPDDFGQTAIWFEKTQWWNTQPRPYKAPLSFQCTVSRVDKDVNPYDIRHGTSYCTVPPDHLLVAAQNRAYSQLKESLGEQQQWANNFLEYRKTVDSIADRASQLYRFTVALRRGRFGDALAYLGLHDFKYNSKKLEKIKNFGDLWLEFHFGWEPLVKDIGLGVETLTSFDPGSRWLRARASARDRDLTRSPPASFDSLSWETHVLYGAMVRFENPNHALADRLGFVNPLSIAWENVPFSFVVDWFVNVGDCLAAFTDFSGTTLLHKWNTSKVIGVRKSQLWFHAGWLDTTYVRTVRTAGVIPGPVLAVKPFKGLSVTRAATAIALLLKGLKA